MEGDAGGAGRPGRGALHDLALCLRFYGRLPVPRLPGEPDPHRAPDFATLPRVLPLAGAILALPAALALAAGWRLGLGAFLSAALAVAVLVASTGALHEDGLADVADGFGGGGTRERRLEIMRDPRIGAYGGAALALALLLRVGALAALLDRLGTPAAAALMLAAALSRLFALLPMALLPPARADGLAAGVGRPRGGSLALAGATGLALAGLAVPLGLPWRGVALMGIACALAALALTRIAHGKIGGQTGDVIGACQQAAEVAGLLALVAAVG